MIGVVCQRGCFTTFVPCIWRGVTSNHLWDFGSEEVIVPIEVIRYIDPVGASDFVSRDGGFIIDIRIVLNVLDKFINHVLSCPDLLLFRQE